MNLTRENNFKISHDELTVVLYTLNNGIIV